MNNKKYDSKNLVTIAIFAAVTFVLGISPLGFIPIGLINATTMHLPVIIAAIYVSPKIGAVVGAIFGIISLFRSIFIPSVMTPFIMNPLVSVLPRIFIGLVAGYLYLFLSKKSDKKLRLRSIIFWLVCSVALVYIIYSGRENLLSFGSIVAIIGLFICLFMAYKSFKSDLKEFPVAVSAFAGSLTNTIGFLSALYLLYGKQYALAVGSSPDLARNLIFSIGISSGMPEAIISVIITTAIIKALKRVR